MKKSRQKKSRRLRGKRLSTVAAAATATTSLLGNTPQVDAELIEYTAEIEVNDGGGGVDIGETLLFRGTIETDNLGVDNVNGPDFLMAPFESFRLEVEGSATKIWEGSGGSFSFRHDHDAIQMYFGTQVWCGQGAGDPVATYSSYYGYFEPTWATVGLVSSGNDLFTSVHPSGAPLSLEITDPSITTRFFGFGVDSNFGVFGDLVAFNDSFTPDPDPDPEPDPVPSYGTGDADCDGDVDLDDVILAVGSFTGPCTVGVDCFGDAGNDGSIFTKIRADGDVNDGMPVTSPPGTDPTYQSDGDVDLDDIIDMVGAFTGPLDVEGGALFAAAGDPGLPDLIYNATTGEVKIDGTDLPGNGFQAYNIKNAGGGILNGTYDPFLSGVLTDLPTEIGEFTLGVTTTPVPVSLGEIFPVGMDFAALDVFVTGGSAAGSNGGGSFVWELFVEGPAVPEPSTAVLAAVAGMAGLIALRRKRGQ